MLRLNNNRLPFSTTKSSATAFMRRFAQDEEGGIIIMTILLLMTMLVVGGMAVDFMRFESRRAMLQSVADRSVLAAAELDQTLPPDEVVIDFFETAGYGDTIIGTPTIDPGSNSRGVSVEAAIDVDTFYLRLVGIDTLTAPARASAVEGTGNIEVSLVLDISGSMGSWVSSESATRIDLLRDAAQDFVDDLLLPEYEDRVSINLIAYSQNVGIGDELYKQLRTTPDTVVADGTTVSSFSTLDEFEDDPAVDIGAEVAPPTEDHFVNPARCIDFEPEEFNTLTFNTDRVYQQVEYFEHYSSGDSGIDLPVCPEEDFEQIILLSQDAQELKDAIELYRPTTFTSIHLGLKWGVSLLDPSMRETLGRISSIDDAFEGERPADYDDANTIKYLILMTDGNNVRGMRINRAQYWDGNDDVYDDDDGEFTAYEWQTIWDEYPMYYWLNNIDTNGYSATDATTGVANYPTTATLHDTWMQQLCTLAKDPDNRTTVYTIAMGANAHGTEEMRKCATSDTYAYSTNLSGSEDQPGIDEIFDAIAQQITALRLNL